MALAQPVDSVIVRAPTRSGALKLNAASPFADAVASPSPTVPIDAARAARGSSPLT